MRFRQRTFPNLQFRAVTALLSLKINPRNAPVTWRETSIVVVVVEDPSAAVVRREVRFGHCVEWLGTETAPTS